jgi:DNA-binding protein H-NS
MTLKRSTGLPKKRSEADVEEAVALRPYVEGKQRGKRSDAGAPALVVYRDPQNPENTWSGRGRAARWLAAYEDQRRNREEFRVSAAMSPQG